MAKIICITSGLTGILNASFELVRRLENKGHEVICAGPDLVKERMLAQGIRFEVLEPRTFNSIPDIPNAGKNNKWKNLFYRYKNKKQLKEKALDAIYPKDYITFLKSHQPDLLLLDIELHEYIILSHTQNIPILLLNQFFSVWKRPGLPSITSGTIPGEGFGGSKIGIQWSWISMKIRRWITFKKMNLLSGGTDRRSTLLNLAKREHFPVNYIGDSLWPGPFLYNELPVINMVYEGLEFPHDKRPNSYYVGPMVYEGRKDKLFRITNSYTLEDALEYVEKINAKLIYCSVSTLSKSDFSFLEKVIEAVKTEKDWVLIMSTGGLASEPKIKEGAQNIFTFSYLPQLKVLAKADCSINHGGMHTINECIHFQVPMLVYSGGKSDQNGTAARVAYHELGLRGDRRNDGVGEIREKIKKVLGNKDYKDNVSKLMSFQQGDRKYFFEEIIGNIFSNR